MACCGIYQKGVSSCQKTPHYAICTVRDADITESATFAQTRARGGIRTMPRFPLEQFYWIMDFAMTFADSTLNYHILVYHVCFSIACNCDSWMPQLLN